MLRSLDGKPPTAPGIGEPLVRSMIRTFFARRFLRRSVAVIVAGSLLFVSAIAWAQDLTAAERAKLEARKAALFQQTLQNPANLDITFAYADAAARLGDNEAAVAALERMLLFNPNLPRVDLELGALYFRMGSYETSRTYFDKALAAHPPPEVRQHIEEYITQINERQSPQRFVGYIFMGAQYQSDANVAPGSPLIHSPIGDVLLASEFVKHHDFDIFGSAVSTYSYDLGTQNRDTLEVGSTLYASHYMQIGRLDLDFAEVTLGPRLRFPHPQVSDVLSATFRPYLITNEVGLGEHQYFWTAGTGLELTAKMRHEVDFRGAFEYRHKDFANAPDRPISTGLNGSDKLVILALSKMVTPTSQAGVEADFLDQDTALAFYTNRTYSLSASYRVRYADPTHTLTRPWETAFFASRSWGYYAAPDPCCSTSGNPAVASFSNRFDRHWRFGLSQTFQVRDNFGIIVQLQRDIVSSDLPLYAYSSNSATIGAEIKF